MTARGGRLTAACAMLLGAAVLASAHSPASAAASAAAAVVRRPAVTAVRPPVTPMPVGNLPGWRQIFIDDFTGSRLDTRRWFTYGGVPLGAGGGRFAGSHVSVSGGLLQVVGYQDPAYGGVWTTGGLSNRHAVARAYGKYLVRFRIDQGRGVPYAILLWPSDNSSTTEIDFAEDNGADRAATKATLHRVRGGKRERAERDVRANFSQWHTVGVEWLPGRISYTLDGAVWSTVVGDAVPNIPMSLAIQTQTWACGHSWEICPGAYTPPKVRLQVDWVVAYAPASPASGGP